jgi:EmrB/QacA subfamily drug resistance transporter
MSAIVTSGGARWCVFAACVLAGLTNEMSGGALTFAIGHARRDLDLSGTTTQMVLTLSKLFFGAFMLAGGTLGDIYGRRRVLVFGAVGVVAASLLAGGAQSSGMLVAARALDGMANAAIGPLALALVISTFSRDDQERVIGLYLGLSGLGVALGPLAAAWVIQSVGWRASFLTPAVLAIIGGLGIYMFAREGDTPAVSRRLDGIGALACAVGLMALVFSIIQANSTGWLSVPVIGSLAVAAATLTGFVWWERRVADPLFELSLFHNRLIVITLITGVTVALVVAGVVLPFVYFLQTVQGFTPIGIALRLMPLVLAAACLSPIVGMLMPRWGPRVITVAGLLLIAIGSGSLTRLQPETPYTMMLPMLLLLGAGYIAVLTPVTNVLMGAVSAERSGTAAAINNAAGQVGGALGIALMTSLVVTLARSTYLRRLEGMGLSAEQIREITQAWRQALSESASTGTRVMPEAVRQVDAVARQALADGVGDAFMLAGLVCLICAALVWFGLKSPSVSISGPVPRLSK